MEGWEGPERHGACRGGEGLHPRPTPRPPPVPTDSGAVAYRPGSLDQWHMPTSRKAAGPAQGGGAQAELEPRWLGESPKTSVDNSMNQTPLPLKPSCYSRGNHKIPQEAKNTWGTGSRVETGLSY